MILYIKTFPLGKGISFSRYIEILDEQSFPPYTLLIERVPFTEDVHVEIVLTDIMALGRFGSSGLFGEMLFNEATITYAGEKDFTLRASVGLGNLLLLSFYIVLSVFFLLSIISIIITRNMPLANIFFSLLPAIVLYPMVSKYFREKKFLDRIGSIGSDTNGK